MRPRLATVVSPRPWEAQIVTAIRCSGLVRLAGRFCDASALMRAEPGLDVVAFDTTTPWIGPGSIERWRGRQIITVGFAPAGDRRAAEVLEECDLVFAEDDSPRRVLAGVVAIGERRSGGEGGRRSAVIPVIGGRGAPGCTEVALAMAAVLASRGSTALIESDPSAPGIGLRLGLPPGPRPARWNGIEVMQARSGRPAVTRELERAARDHDFVVVDAGVDGDHGPDPGQPILVVDPTPGGVVRAGWMIQRWTAAQPAVVVNRAPSRPEERELALRRVRAATGLEPAAVVERVTVRWGEAPPVEMVEALESLAPRAGAQGAALR